MENSESPSTTINCPICFEDFPREVDPIDVEAGEALEPKPNVVVLSKCQHSFCETCLQSHIEESIQHRRMVDIKCPFVSSCGESIESEQVRTLLSQHEDSKLSELFERLKLLDDNPDWLECPACTAAVPPNRKNPAQPNDIECSQCQITFCKIHGQSHAGQPCYLYTMDADMIASENLLNSRTVPCSHCGARLQRSRGCSYVVCSACHNDMCYDCRTHIHLSEGRLRYCTNCSTPLAGHGQASCGMNCVLLVLLLVVMLLWIVLATFVAVLTVGCCAGYCCGRGLKYHESGRRWAPRRGWLAVLVTIFLPCLSSLESEEFVDRHVPFFLADLVADEIPVMSPESPVSPTVGIEMGEATA